jgi:hypothetical protein
MPELLTTFPAVNLKTKPPDFPFIFINPIITSVPYPDVSILFLCIFL